MRLHGQGVLPLHRPVGCNPTCKEIAACLKHIESSLEVEKQSTHCMPSNISVTAKKSTSFRSALPLIPHPNTLYRDQPFFKTRNYCALMLNNICSGFHVCMQFVYSFFN